MAMGRDLTGARQLGRRVVRLLVLRRVQRRGCGCGLEGARVGVRRRDVGGASTVVARRGPAVQELGPGGLGSSEQREGEATGGFHQEDGEQSPFLFILFLFPLCCTSLLPLPLLSQLFPFLFNLLPLTSYFLFSFAGFLHTGSFFK